MQDEELAAICNMVEKLDPWEAFECLARILVILTDDFGTKRMHVGVKKGECCYDVTVEMVVP